MSKYVDPRSPVPQPNPFGEGRSDGSPGQPRGTHDVEPGGTGAQPEPLPEYFSDASGAPLPPVIEAFPGYRGVPKPPKKVAKKVVGSRVTRWPAIVAVGAARIAAILAPLKMLAKKVLHSRVIRSPAGVGIGVAGIAVILVVAVITVLLTHRRGPNPRPPAAQPAPSAALPSSPSPPPTPTTPDQLDGILLSVADISAVMGGDMEVIGRTFERLAPLDGGVVVSHPDCQGAFDAVRGAVYAGSGQTAVRFQNLFGFDGDTRVVTQGAVTFPSADEASRFVQNSAGKWKSCENQTAAQTMEHKTYEWTFASLNGKPPTITLNRTTMVGKRNYLCQRALRAVSNVVIDVKACNYHITNEGSQIADKMVAKVKGQWHDRPLGGRRGTGQRAVCVAAAADAWSASDTLIRCGATVDPQRRCGPTECRCHGEMLGPDLRSTTPSLAEGMPGWFTARAAIGNPA